MKFGKLWPAMTKENDFAQMMQQDVTKKYIARSFSQAQQGHHYRISKAASRVDTGLQKQKTLF